jgi:hypothetical protein
MIGSAKSMSNRSVTAGALLLTVLILSACGNPDGVTGAATPTLIPTLDGSSFAAADPASTTVEATPEPASAESESAQPVEAGAVETEGADSAVTASESISATETVTGAVAAETEVDPSVFFAQPTNYALLPITSTIVMGVEGLEVQPAGEVVDGAGHLHLLIDTDFVPAGEAIAKDEEHLHFGADGAHIALDGDQYRAEIEVLVAEDAADQAVYFVAPADGDVVTPTLEITMGASGLIVEPAGEVRDGAGHMHILIDTDFIPVGEAVPKDETHRHFGGGQTSATLELEPGEHVLRLQFTNGAHIVLEGEQYQDEITIVVEEP